MRPRRRARAARPTPTPTPTPTPSSRDDDRPPPAASSSSFASLPTSLARRFVALAAWKRFALITLVVAGPYALYVSYLWIRLQSGLLRAPVRVATPRAVLIVGTQSSGTTQMSAELGKIGLEVAHETSDAQWEFARDGTISWLHALRFMPGRADLAFTTAFCSRFRRSMGFHPAMFGPPELGCSYRKTWDDCWRSQCGVIARREWGCARSGSCETPFETSLLQLRHPLRTMESLAAKFCGRAVMVGSGLSAPNHLAR